MASWKILAKGRGGYLWRWTPFAVALVAFFSLGRLTGASQRGPDRVKFKNVEAERLEIRGADGKEAASLARGSKGEALLTFFDQGHEARLMIGLDAHGTPSIFFLGANHIPTLSIAVDPKGGEPAIHLYDDQGQPTISLGITKGFGPSLSIGKVGQASPLE